MVTMHRRCASGGLLIGPKQSPSPWSRHVMHTKERGFVTCNWVHLIFVPTFEKIEGEKNGSSMRVYRQTLQQFASSARKVWNKSIKIVQCNIMDKYLVLRRIHYILNFHTL